MKFLKSTLSVMLISVMLISSFVFFGTIDAAAASYPTLPALQITRVYQPDYDTNGMCYWASMATVQGYCLGTYTYGGVTTNYREPGKDYDYLKRGDAITKYFKDHADGYANAANNLNNNPIKMTRVTSGIGKNSSTYQKIYDQLAQGKPVIVYTGTHASVVIAYNGSTTTLQPSGFTVLEVKKDGRWWSNSTDYYNTHANKPQVDSASGSYMSCYVTLDSWISYCGNKLQEICYPTDAVNTDYTFGFNANGGTGSMSSLTVQMGKTITFPECTFTYEGYTCDGYYAQRKSDGKWHATGIGWRTLQEILDNNYSRSVYATGLTFDMNTSWTKEGGVVGDTFTLFPIWKPLKTSLNFYGNYSGTNYMMSINKDTFSDYYQSRNSSVYTVSTGSSSLSNIIGGIVSDLPNSVLNSDHLVITGSSAGSTGKDLLFKTQTNQSPNNNFNAGDSKAMTLTFRAKSSVEGAKMIFRWGYTSDTTAVILSTSWQEYTVDMSKQPNDGAHMHPYFDKAGTFYIADISLTDSGVQETSSSETVDLLYTDSYAVGGTYGILPTPTRDGYTFKGWYTSKTGGTQVTADTAVFDSHTAVYARWEENSAESILMGDADLDGSISIKDATAIQKHLAGLTNLTAAAKFVGNVMSADDLNIKDATAIQKWLAGLNTGNAVINEYADYE